MNLLNILVTGGAGFIGSHLVDELLKEGHSVIIVDNFSLGTHANIHHLKENSKVVVYEQDITDLSKYDSIFSKHKIDIVFHMAANSDIAKSFENPNVDMDNTFLTTYNTLLCMKKYNVKKIVFASTSAIYGETTERLTENFGPLVPASHYGASKLASEAFIYSFASNYGIQVWVTRFPNVVGERATHGVIFDFINRLRINPNQLDVLGNGKQYKPYLYVKDLISGIMFVYKNTNEQINIFNLGVESRTRVYEIAEMVVKSMGLNSKITYTDSDRGWVGDVPEFNYNLDKIHKLGWKAESTSNEAMQKAVEYILKSN